VTTAAIIGAGDIGGAAAHALARRESASRIWLVDDAGAAAAGKALDIQQSGAIEGFGTELGGTADISSIIGCDVCIVADRFGPASPEWQGDEALAHLVRVIATIPGMEATRHGQSSATNFYRSGGIGDVTVGAQAWVWRPPTESHGNVAISAQLKLPTGINDAKGTAFAKNGTSSTQPFDESIQPGDGTYGFALATEAYRELYWRTSAYFTGSWLFSPQDTTGVAQARSAPGENVISATDQYLWRGGFSRPVTGVKLLRGLALSFGGRMEGVPVRDAFGASNGFRRPGYVISIEPGMMYSRGRWGFYASGPWAMERNRKTSVTDIANHTHGDAAFADYTVITGISRTF